MRSQRGSIYLEAIVAMAILAAVIIPAYGMFATRSTVQSETAQYNAALNLARAKLEEIHSSTTAEWERLESGTEFEPPYTITRLVKKRSNLDLDLKDVTITVSWTDRRGEQSISLTTSVARRGNPDEP